MNVLGNVLEVEVAIVAKDPAGECDEEFSERWMHIYEIRGFDVLGGEFAEVHFIETGEETGWSSEYGACWEDGRGEGRTQRCWVERYGKA